MDPRTLTDDFKEFLRLLNDNDVEYLVVGGHAVAFHGYPEQPAISTYGLKRTVKVQRRSQLP